MEKLPSKVYTKLQELKIEHRYYLQVTKVNQRYYVYEQTTRWDTSKKKVVTISNYLGKIDSNGTFTPAQKRVHPIDLDIQTKTAKSQEESSEATTNVGVEKADDKYDNIILTALSMNARISAPALSKIVGLSPTSVKYRIRNMEKRYNIKYLAEIDITKLGYFPFLVMIKFADRQPSINALKSILSKEPRVQLALVTKGEFDIIMYILAKNNIDLDELLYKNLRIKLNYAAEWRISPTYLDYGYLPIKTEFIETLKRDLLLREYAVLKELSKNGAVNLTDIDKKYGFDKGRATYSYHKLRQSGTIKRITISMDGLPVKYTGILLKIFIDYEKFRANRQKSLYDIIGTVSRTNKYALVDDIINPFGVIMYLPVFKDGDLEFEAEKLYDLGLGIKLSTLTATVRLIGNFCYRRFDNAHSVQQEILEKEYGVPHVKRLSYGEPITIEREEKAELRTILKTEEPED